MLCLLGRQGLLFVSIRSFLFLEGHICKQTVCCNLIGMPVSVGDFYQSVAARAGAEKDISTPYLGKGLYKE